jgi:hypothetical protein
MRFGPSLGVSATTGLRPSAHSASWSADGLRIAYAEPEPATPLQIINLRGRIEQARRS